MNRMRILVLVSTALLAPGTVLADGSPRTGTAGFQELRIPVGPRGTALSGAGIADVTGVEAMVWNPAGGAYASGSEIMASSMTYIGDSRVSFLGAVKQWGDDLSLGLAIRSVSFGEIPVTTEEAGGPTGETYSPGFFALGVSVARRLSERISLGVTANLADESIRNEHARGVAFDLGFQYDPGWNGLRFGAAVRNFGPDVNFEGPDFGAVTPIPDADPSAQPRTLVSESSAFDLPATFQIGAAVEAYGDETNRIVVLSTFESNTYSSDAYRFGAEYGWNDRLTLRAGATAAPEAEETWGFTVGGGVNANLGDGRVGVEYARQASSSFFEDQNLISIRFGF